MQPKPWLGDGRRTQHDQRRNSEKIQKQLKAIGNKKNVDKIIRDVSINLGRESSLLPGALLVLATALLPAHTSLFTWPINESSVVSPAPPVPFFYYTVQFFRDVSVPTLLIVSIEWNPSAVTDWSLSYGRRSYGRPLEFGCAALGIPFQQTVLFVFAVPRVNFCDSGYFRCLPTASFSRVTRASVIDVRNEKLQHKLKICIHNSSQSVR